MHVGKLFRLIGSYGVFLPSLDAKSFSRFSQTSVLTSPNSHDMGLVQGPCRFAGGFFRTRLLAHMYEHRV